MIVSLDASSIAINNDKDVGKGGSRFKVVKGGVNELKERDKRERDANRLRVY